MSSEQAFFPAMAQTKNGQRAAQLSPVPLVCDEGETQEPELEAGSALWLQLLTWSTGQQQGVPEKTHRVRDPGFTPTPPQPYPVPATHGSSLGALSKGCNQSSSKVTLTLMGDKGKGGPGHCVCLSPRPLGAERQGPWSVLMGQEQQIALAVSSCIGGTQQRLGRKSPPWH